MPRSDHEPLVGIHLRALRGLPASDLLVRFGFGAAISAVAGLVSVLAGSEPGGILLAFRPSCRRRSPSSKKKRANAKRKTSMSAPSSVRPHRGFRHRGLAVHGRGVSAGRARPRHRCLASYGRASLPRTASHCDATKPARQDNRPTSSRPAPVSGPFHTEVRTLVELLSAHPNEPDGSLESQSL